MKKSLFFDKLLLLLAALSLLLGGVGLTFFPAARFSAAENRNLAAFPAFTLASLTNGSYTAALDRYAAERFPARPLLRALYAVGELSLGKREVRGVILCRDGSLLRRIPTDEVAFSQNITAIRQLCGNASVPFKVAIVPRRIDARAALLPALYQSTEEAGAWATLPQEWCCLAGGTEDAQWFRTDHHWTADGAYYAYVQLARSLGYTPLAASEFSRVCVSEDFLGTTDAAAGIPGVTPDRITLYLRGDEAEYRVLRDGVPAPFEGFYDMEKLTQRDQYAVFLGGNCGVCEVTQGEQDTRPQLVVIRDSFACALLPFLARHFRIFAIDPRYARFADKEVLAAADAALLLCGLQTLTEGRFLAPAGSR